MGRAMIRQVTGRRRSEHTIRLVLSSAEQRVEVPGLVEVEEADLLRDVERPLRAAGVAEELLEQAQVVADVADVLLLQHGPDDRDRGENDQRQDRDVDRTEERQQRVVPGLGNGRGFGPCGRGGGLFLVNHGGDSPCVHGLPKSSHGQPDQPAGRDLNSSPPPRADVDPPGFRAADAYSAPPWHPLHSVGALAAMALASVLWHVDALAGLAVDHLLACRAACPWPRHRGT